MFTFLRNLHNRRPLLWTVIAFIVVIATATTLSVWWNYLLVQNDHILRQMAAAASKADQTGFPLAILMILGILLSVMIVLGLVYMFLRLIRAVQLNVAQSQFIAAVTHELRSPVSSLQLMLDTIRDGSTPADVRREFEELMDADLKRLRGLVDQVLDTARLENFALPSSREPIAVQQLLRSCQDAFDTRLRTSAGTLHVPELRPELHVVGNMRLLTTVITNVLDNAFKYSRGPADVTIRVTESNKSVEIEIQDQGIGIEATEQKRIFKRFYRSGNPLTQGRPGTGLGLYFARLAMRSLGGNISVTSPGHGLGSTFRVEVPKQ